MKRQQNLVLRYALWFIVAPVLLTAKSAGAQMALDSTYTGDFAPTIDGDYGDWLGDEMGEGATFVSLGGGELVSGEEGWTDGDDLSAEMSFAHNPRDLFFAYTVRDDRFSRAGKPSSDGDHVEFWFGVQNSRRQKLNTFGIGVWADFKHGGGGVEIRWLKPGGPKVGKKVRGAAGALTGDANAYNVEVSLPWSVIPGGSALRGGVRAGVFVVDCDTAAKIKTQSVLGTAPIAGRGSAENLPLLGQSDLTASVDAFWEKVRLPSNTGPHFATSANLAGDATPEQLIIVDRYVMAYGGAIGPPGTFRHLRLPVESAEQITKKLLLDTTGDRKKEIVLELLEDKGTSTRRWVAVYKLSQELQIERIFSAAILVSDGIVKIENRYRFRKKGGKVRAVEIAPVSAEGVDKDAPAGEIPEQDGNPMVLPWHKPAKIKYRYRKGRFTRE